MAKRRRGRRSDPSSRQPPWVERPLFVALLRHLTGRGFLAWRRVETEAAALRARVKKQKLTWPPESFISTNPFPHLPSAVQVIDPMSPAVAAELPSVQVLFGKAIGRLFSGQGPTDHKAREQFIANMAATYHSLLVWRSQSRHVLRIHRTLLEDLAHAEPATLKGSDLFLPVPALYIEFPTGITMTDPLDESKRLNVRGALVSSEHEDPDHYRHRELRVAIVGKRKRRWPVKVEPILTFRLELGNRSLAIPRFVPQDIVRKIQIPERMPVGSEAREDPTRSEPAPQAPNDIVVLVIRLLDYLMSTPEDRRRLRQRGAANRRGHTPKRPLHSTTSSYWAVGRAYAASAQAGSWRKGKPLTYVIHVRAHYRNQAWGPGLRWRRRRKIARHQRGPRQGLAHTTIQRLTRPE